MARSSPRIVTVPVYDQAVVMEPLKVAGSADYGSRGSTYELGLMRRGITGSAQRGIGVGGAGPVATSYKHVAESPAPGGSAFKTIGLAAGMQSLARDCQCNGLAVGAAGPERLAHAHARFAHSNAEAIEALVEAGVSVPAALLPRLGKEAAELADIRTILEARLILGRGGRLTLEQAQRFQDAARRLGLLRGGGGKRKRKRGGLGSLLVGACCGALDAAFGVGGKKRRKRR